jgi:hypothetical protein
MASVIRHAPTPVLQPPAGLSEPARAAFVALVGDCAPDHFEPADTTLLARYANATVFSEQAEARLAANPDDRAALALWEKATRTMSGLALRLRLGPQSRRERAKIDKPLTWSDEFRLKHYGRL